jgi:hypothetical protein
MTEKNTATPSAAPFLIHGLRPEGLNYVASVYEGNPHGAQQGRLEYGAELLVTPELVLANTDRLGSCWLLMSEDEQRAAYRGTLRFGVGPATEAVRAQVRAARRAEIEEQRRNVLANSHAAGRYAAERSFVAALDAELAALDVEAQGS